MILYFTNNEYICKHFIILKSQILITLAVSK